MSPPSPTNLPFSSRRVRLACSCKSLLRQSSHGWWASLELAPAGLMQALLLTPWVLARRANVRHLSLKHLAPAARAAAGEPAAEQQLLQQWQQSQQQRPLFRSLTYFVSILAGGPLESLSWRSPLLPCLGESRLALPQLRRLHLVISDSSTTGGGGGCDIDGEQQLAHPHQPLQQQQQAAAGEWASVRLQPDFGARFPQLKELRLEGSLLLDWAPGCLPPGLQALTVEGCLAVAGQGQQSQGVLAAIAAAASSGTALSSLTLSICPLGGGGPQQAAVPLQGLERLGASLTRLRLRAPGPLPQLGPLAACTGLRSLELLGFDSWAAVGGQEWSGCLQPLAALTRLTALQLGGTGAAATQPPWLALAAAHC